MTGYHQILYLVNLHLIGAFTLLSPYLWLQIHQVWCHMEDFHHVLSQTPSRISDPLQPTRLLARVLLQQILHILPLLLVGRLSPILCLSIRKQLLIHTLNPDLCLIFHVLQLGQPSRCPFGPNNELAWLMTRNQRRNTRLSPCWPPLHQHLADRKIRVTCRWMMTLMTPKQWNPIELPQSVLAQTKLPQLQHHLHPC